MALGASPIAGDPIASLEALAGLAASSNVCGDKARWIASRIAGAFARRCAEMALLIRPAAVDADGTAREVWVRTVWSMTRAEELAGDVRQSDHTVFIDPADVVAGRFPRPLVKGDRLVRWPATDRERVHTTLETPGLFDVSGEDVLYRLIVRG